MKKIILILILINSITVKANGPTLKNKLTPPEKHVIQTLQKRGLTWIQGQWETINNNYQWKSGHWTEKKIGYIFINGRWEKSKNGWKWQDGYWRKININKWMSLNN